jgi:hypothetical protein
MKLAAQQREQARFAAAVGADEADAPAGMDLQARALDQPPRAASKGEITELDQWSATSDE